MTRAARRSVDVRLSETAVRALPDIHPLARQARAVVVIEQVTGVMYVAILIARLTGMTLVRSSPRGGEDR